LHAGLTLAEKRPEDVSPLRSAGGGWADDRKHPMRDDPYTRAEHWIERGSGRQRPSPRERPNGGPLQRAGRHYRNPGTVGL